MHYAKLFNNTGCHHWHRCPNIWLFCPSTSFLLLANLTNPSKYSSFLGITRIVSMGVKKIFPLMKWDRILDYTVASTPMFVPLCFSLTIPFSCFSTRLAIIGNLLFGILTPKKICWSPPQIWVNFERVASSSSTKISRKFVVANKTFAGFFQHLSFVCLNPK